MCVKKRRRLVSELLVICVCNLWLLSLCRCGRVGEEHHREADEVSNLALTWSDSLWQRLIVWQVQVVLCFWKQMINSLAVIFWKGRCNKLEQCDYKSGVHGRETVNNSCVTNGNKTSSETESIINAHWEVNMPSSVCNCLIRGSCKIQDDRMWNVNVEKPQTQLLG